MRVEAVGTAFTYRWPNGSVYLEPGKPVELPDERAQRLLMKAAGRVRAIPPAVPVCVWLARWKELARVTSGLVPDDPRLDPVLRVLTDCDRYYKAGDVDSFTKTAKQVRRLMLFTPGARVRWEGHMNHLVCIFGPAVVEHVLTSDGRLWVWVTWKGQGRWVCESIVKEIREPR